MKHYFLLFKKMASTTFMKFWKPNTVVNTIEKAIKHDQRHHLQIPWIPKSCFIFQGVANPHRSRFLIPILTKIHSIHNPSHIRMEFTVYQPNHSTVHVEGAFFSQISANFLRNQSEYFNGD